MFGKKRRKGQSALGYLVTYGWAILAIVIIAAVLWYFGIFNPGSWVQAGTRATGFTVFSIIDQQFGINQSTTVSYAKLYIGNSLGQDILIENLTVVDGTTVKANDTNANGGSISPETQSQTFSAGSSATFYVKFGTAMGFCSTTGAAYKDVVMTINYTNKRTGFKGLVDTGRISGKCA